ncbi:MAG: hypothetical protein WA821_09500 [Anaerolineales bacterium]
MTVDVKVRVIVGVLVFVGEAPVVGVRVLVPVGSGVFVEDPPQLNCWNSAGTFGGSQPVWDVCACRIL